MTRSENEVDQIVFRWDSENLSGSTGFGPVAWSGPRDEAENLFRISGPVLRASGEETRPALIRLQRRADVMLIRRTPFRAADGRTSVLCHALVGSPELLEPATCLGLHAWNWEGADIDAARVRGQLPVIPEDVLVPATGRGQGELDRTLQHVVEELTGTVAELLRQADGRFTVLDERGDTACSVLWGLHSMFGTLTERRWTFATHDTVELPALRFVFVGRWSGAASSSSDRRRVDPCERVGDRVEETAARLVAHHLRGVAEGEGGEYTVVSALHAASSARRASLLDVATRALDALDRAAAGGSPYTGHMPGPGTRPHPGHLPAPGTRPEPAHLPTQGTRPQAGHAPAPGARPQAGQTPAPGARPQAGRTPDPGARPQGGASWPPVSDPRSAPPASVPEPEPEPERRKSSGRKWGWGLGGRNAQNAPPPSGATTSGPPAPRDGTPPEAPSGPGRADTGEPRGAVRPGPSDRPDLWFRQDPPDPGPQDALTPPDPGPQGALTPPDHRPVPPRRSAEPDLYGRDSTPEADPYGSAPAPEADPYWSDPATEADPFRRDSTADDDPYWRDPDPQADPSKRDSVSETDPYWNDPAPEPPPARPKSPDPQADPYGSGPDASEAPPRPGRPESSAPPADSYGQSRSDAPSRPARPAPSGHSAGPYRYTRSESWSGSERPHRVDPQAHPSPPRPADPPLRPDLTKPSSGTAGREDPPGALGGDDPSGRPEARATEGAGGRAPAKPSPHQRAGGDPYPRPVLPFAEPTWNGPGATAGGSWARVRGRGREREVETGLVHKLPTARTEAEVRGLVERGGSRELLDALRRPQSYVVLTVLLKETARRLPSWEHPLRRELCEVAIGRELWAVAPPGADADTEPAEEQRAANAAALHRWAVRPLLGRGDAPVGTVAELLSRLRTSPAPPARETFWLIIDGERPGLPEEVWLSLLKEAYGVPRTAPRPAAPASGSANHPDDPGNSYTRRFLRRAGMLIGGLVVAILLLVAVGEWFS